MPEITASLVIDILLSFIAGMLLWELKKHISDDNIAHKQLREEAKDYARDEDTHLEKRIVRIENYLNGKLK